MTIEPDRNSIHLMFSEENQMIIPASTIGIVKLIDKKVILGDHRGGVICYLEGDIAKAYWGYALRDSVTFLDKPENWELDLTQFDIADLRGLVSALSDTIFERPLKGASQMVPGDALIHILELTTLERVKLLKQVSEALALLLEAGISDEAVAQEVVSG